jgi:uncharacterized protein
MSQENVEIVRRVIGAVATGDSTTVLELVSPDIEWDFSHVDTWLEDRVYRGYGGVGEFLAKWRGEWDDYRFEVEDVIDAGDKAVAFIRDEGRSKTTGMKLERRHAEVWSFRDGRVIRIEPFDRRGPALEAVGLSEQDAHTDS